MAPASNDCIASEYKQYSFRIDVDFFLSFEDLLRVESMCVGDEGQLAVRSVVGVNTCILCETDKGAGIGILRAAGPAPGSPSSVPRKVDERMGFPGSPVGGHVFASFVLGT